MRATLLAPAAPQLFSSALREAFSDLTDPPAALTPSTKENFGDYQCNSAMNIAQVKKNSWIFLKIPTSTAGLCQAWPSPGQASCLAWPGLAARSGSGLASATARPGTILV